MGYIIGPRLGALNFAGGVFAWGLLVPLLAFFLGPQLAPNVHGRTPDWAGVAGAIWYHIVRPIAVGGMLVGASLHAVPDAQEPGHRHEARGGRPEEVRGGARSHHAARSAT